MKEQQVNQPDPGFSVDIRSGRRAVAEAAPQEPHAERKNQSQLTPAQARKNRNRTYAFLATGAFALFVAAIVGWQWWTTRVPDGVMARVNGQEITQAQIDREILVTRMLGALVDGKEPDPAPTRSSMLESLISIKMESQDATKAGIPVTDADLDQVVNTMLTKNSLTEDNLNTALKGYGLTRGALYEVLRDTELINRYTTQYVIKGATSSDQASQLMNDWQIQLQRTSVIERFTAQASDLPQVGSPAPEIQLATLQDSYNSDDPITGATPVAGKDFIKLSSLKGHPIIVNFWATWCEPCRTELPELAKTYDANQTSAPAVNPSLEVLGVLVDSDPTTALSFKKEFGLDFLLLIDVGGQVKDAYRVGPIPTSYFIDRQGIIRYVQVGMLDQATITEKLKLIQ